MTPASPVHILMLRRRWIQSRSWNTVFVLSQVRTSVVLGEAHEFLYGCALLPPRRFLRLKRHPHSRSPRSTRRWQNGTLLLAYTMYTALSTRTPATCLIPSAPPPSSLASDMKVLRFSACRPYAASNNLDSSERTSIIRTILHRGRSSGVEVTGTTTRDKSCDRARPRCPQLLVSLTTCLLADSEVYMSSALFTLGMH
ncbi:hypothetical protein C8Q72DRAFT_222619 [Fomitopsis betulina]|nr:hypothetical protein C8Q72DRAFT_222619 [Fomitopsis betulina]